MHGAAQQTAHRGAAGGQAHSEGPVDAVAEERQTADSAHWCRTRTVHEA